MIGEIVLEVRDLHTHFFLRRGVVKAVDGVSFSLRRGEVLGLVGESGCGKSLTALSLMRLLPKGGARTIKGEVLLDGENILERTPAEMREIRGRRISMVLQDPQTSLNPVFTIGNQIAEAVRLHQGLSKKEAMNKAVEMLTVVGIPVPERRVHEYPHQLSGGMRQRAMIAMALSCNPKVLIADEPTTALDVTIEAQILDLMRNLQHELGTAIIMITHDLGVIAEIARKVVVMYAGKIVEQAPVEQLFAEPNHPYTQGLLQSLPRVDKDAMGAKSRLQEIPGIVPSLLNLPQGCKFASRCPKVMPICEEEEPSLDQVAPQHYSACWLNH